MGRNWWRASRAFRVLLACVALWLPARSASAWVAPADMVVMLAGAGGAAGASGGGVESHHVRANRPSEARCATAIAELARTQVSAFAQRRSRCARALKILDRAAPPPLYLLNCALLC